MSLTAQISAEGLMDWLKAQLTPGKALVASAATAAIYHYWFMRRITRTITINDETIDVHALGLKLSNYKHINAEIVEGSYSTILPDDRSQLDRIVRDTRSGKELFGFNPNYSLNDGPTENKGVSLVYNERVGQMHLPWNWFGCLCCSNTRVTYEKDNNNLATRLYNNIPEATIKADYANKLHAQYQENQSKLQQARTLPRSYETVREIASREYLSEMLVQKSNRLVE